MINFVRKGKFIFNLIKIDIIDVILLKLKQKVNLTCIE